MKINPLANSSMPLWPTASALLQIKVTVWLHQGRGKHKGWISSFLVSHDGGRKDFSSLATAGMKLMLNYVSSSQSIADSVREKWILQKQLAYSQFYWEHT